MNIQKYWAFIKTVELGSFTKAALALQYTQSGVSHMIQDLEREWDVILLERSRAGVQITSDGLKLLPYARQVCEANRELLSELDDLHGLQSGVIRLATFPSIASTWLPKVIKVFQQDFPAIEYELLLGDYTEIEKWINDGRVDFGILSMPTSSHLDFTFLENDRLLVVLSEGHPLADCERFPLKALAEEPFIMLYKIGLTEEVSEIFITHGITPNTRFSAWDNYAVMCMVENGLGIGILSELVLRRNPYHIVTRELEIPAFRKLGVCLKNANNVPRIVNKFLEYLPHRNDL